MDNLREKRYDVAECLLLILSEGLDYKKFNSI